MTLIVALGLVPEDDSDDDIDLTAMAEAGGIEW